MFLRQPIVMLCVLMLIVGVIAGMNLYGQGAAPRAVSVAVLDVEKVFNELDERAAVEANIQTRIGELQQYEQAKRKEVEATRGDLEIMSPDSPNFAKRRDDLRRQLIELQVELEVRKREIEQEKAIQLEGLYRKIIDAVGVIAQQSGYDLVLFRDSTPDMAGANQQQVAAMIQVRKLLYSAQELDITAAVKQKVNNDYKAQ